MGFIMALGGARPGAGRKPGSVSKAKRQLSEMAKEHAENALLTLAEIMMNEDEQSSARVAAANALLDRGYGKPPASLDHTSSDGTMTPTQIVLRAADDSNGNS